MVPPAAQRSALDSASTIHRRLPSGAVDRPEGWLIQTSCSGPSRNASTVVPAYTPVVRATGSNHQS
jgi:hypothetical protein